MINKSRLCSTFMELCSIDSESTKERLMADRLKELLTAAGFEVSEDDAGQKNAGSAGNLFARKEGTGEGEGLLFSCHMDRVPPGIGVRPRIDGEWIVSDGTTVLGADDAAGLAAVIEAVTAIAEGNHSHPPIEIVFTICEELSLLGSIGFDLGKVRATCGFVVDAGGQVGEIVVQAPEQVKIHAIFHGRSAHAGFAPEQGVSAIQIAAAAISRMKLLRVDAETTANIGSISAVSPTNIIPDRCEIRAEARSLDPERLQAQVASMKEAMESSATEFGGSVDLSVVSCYPAYRIPEDSGPARKAALAAERIGVPVIFKSTGGGSDANIFNSRGLPSVVLSAGYEKVHTTEERMPIRQLELLAEWVFALMTEHASS